MMHLVFDGGTLRDGSGIRLQYEELDEYRFVEPAAVTSYLPPYSAPRIPAALRARARGATVYLPQASRIRPDDPWGWRALGADAAKGMRGIGESVQAQSDGWLFTGPQVAELKPVRLDDLDLAANAPRGDTNAPRLARHWPRPTSRRPGDVQRRVTVRRAQSGRI